MIALENVTLRYPGQPNLLENLSLTLAPGDWVTLKGPRSSGKTTLLRLIAGLDQPTSGKITWQGVPLRRASALAGLRQRTGMIWDPHHFIEHLPLHRNLALPLEIQGMAQKEIAPRVTSALQRVGLAGRERLFPHQLSALDQQRLNFARALIGRPTLLLVDELSRASSLIPLLQNLLDAFHQSGVCIVTAITADQPGLLSRGREILITPPMTRIES